MDKSIITNHLYNDSITQAVKYAESIADEETLFVYAYNYNWDNGFDVPTAILKNRNCSLSIALMIFTSADGILYLEDKKTEEGTSTWKNYISNLYNEIINNKFSSGKTAFNPQLSKVQEYKIKKILDDNELIFITPIDGIDCYEKL